MQGGSKRVRDIRVCPHPCRTELILTNRREAGGGGGAARSQKASWVLRGHQLAAPTLNETGAAVLFVTWLGLFGFE